MKISEFRKEYCERRKFNLADIVGEGYELLESLFGLDAVGIKEEFSDVVAFVQLYLHDNLSVDGDLWKLGMPSYDKYQKRRIVWERMYSHFGLTDKCTTCKNYKRIEKVIDHFSQFGIERSRAEEAYGLFCRA